MNDLNFRIWIRRERKKNGLKHSSLVWIYTIKLLARRQDFLRLFVMAYLLKN
jgi:hypothetical protein